MDVDGANRQSRNGCGNRHQEDVASGGDRPTARDVFDLSLVIERDPDGLNAAGTFLLRHRETFLRLLRERRDTLMARFNDIETLGYTPSFDYCAGAAKTFLEALPDAKSPEPGRKRHR